MSPDNALHSDGPRVARPALHKQRRIVYLFFLLWGALALAWSFLVGIKGRFRNGHGGPFITPESDPVLFWVVVIGTSLLGLIVMAVSLVPLLRSFQNEKITT
jgi:hypothetical protein